MDQRTTFASNSDAATLAPGADRLAAQKQPASSPKGRVVVSLRNVHKSYTSAAGDTVDVLKGLNLEIEAGSFNVIRGESGSGKTSLLRILGMLDSDFGGNYLFAGEDVKACPEWRRDELRSDNIGFIFQDGRLLGHLAVRENIALPIRLQGTAEQRRALAKTVAALAPRFFNPDEIKKDILSSRPTQVSSGQKQRAAIMRSVINKPSIILADEPTASLDESRKQEIVKHLLSLCEAGHTVIVVSHDKVFYNSGRQFELKTGVLTEIAPGDGQLAPPLAVRKPSSGASILYGWLPRASMGILSRQAVRETFLRPIFLFLIVISLCVGVCQIGVFASVIKGAQAFLDDAMTKGSRLNRLEIQPKQKDYAGPEKFPVTDTIKASTKVQAVVPRRTSVNRVIKLDGSYSPYSAIGLHPDDPEYRLFNFVAGGPFSPSNDELEVIATVVLLPDLFADAAGLADGTKKYSDFIGRPITIELPRFAPSGQELPARKKRVQVKLVGLILHAEGGRSIYLPNKTMLVFDQFRMDRSGSLTLPLNEAADTWTDRDEVAKLAAMPLWEDRLHVYTKEIRDIIPVFQKLSDLGYKPISDVWNYKWVLDVRDLAWKIFLPLLGLIVLAVGLTVATNIFSSAKLREAEFALWRVLGMRRGDLVVTQVISTILMVLVGTLLGLAIAATLIDTARSFLHDQSPGFEAVFAPASLLFFLTIVVASVIVGVISAIYPAVRTAHADPAKVLQS